MTQIQHHFPGGQTDVHYHDLSIKIQKLLAQVIDRDQLNLGSWTPINGTPLEIRFRSIQGVECLAFKQHGSLAYVSIFRMLNKLPDRPLKVVSRFYKRYKFGEPALPSNLLWIHSFPLYNNKILGNDLTLIHEIILFIYCTKFNHWIAETNDPKVHHLSARIPTIPDTRTLPKAQ